MKGDKLTRVLKNIANNKKEKKNQDSLFYSH